MSVVKRTPLEQPRKFTVRHGYTLHLGNVIYDGGAVLLASTQEILDGIMSQKWKVEESVPQKPVVVAPAIVEPVVTAPAEEPAREQAEAEEEPEVPKAKVAPKPTHSRKTR